MDGGIVKLYSLSDTDRTRTKDDYLFLVGNDRLILLLVGRVEVWNVAFKLGGAGIYHLIDRGYAKLFTQGKDFGFLHIPQQSDLLIGKAHSFCFIKLVTLALMGFEPFFLIYNIFQLTDKEGVYLCSTGDLLLAGTKS